MTGVKLRLDETNSLAVTYHILCAPNVMSRKYNEDIYDNLKVSEPEREQYVNFLASLGYRKQDWFNTRPGTIVIGANGLEDYFSKFDARLSQRYNSELPDEIKNSMRTFEQSYSEYFDKIKQAAEPIIKQRTEQLNETIDYVYLKAKKMTGIKLLVPDMVDIIIVDGLAPSSFGGGINNGTGYVVTQSRHLKNYEDLLGSAVHELVGHQTASAGRQSIIDNFGRHIYFVEEGFVKLFSKKIVDQFLSTNTEGSSSRDLETEAYKIFEKNWKKLDGTNFSEWYFDCVQKIHKVQQKKNLPLGRSI
ncbi:MAG: hypothetical protein ACP5N3_00300 [Candidatus Nanoarchaeia archaeon]